MEDRGKKIRQGGFIVQAGILAVAGIIVRMIGILYRAPLTQIIGDEGNGYYTHAYNIYTIILLISSYSIPSAMSKVVSGYLATNESKNAMKLVRCSLYYVIVVGGVASLLTFFCAPFLVESRSVPVLRIFTPTIFLSGILGVLRGYFQSFKTMVPTSISQIMEQILNAVVSILAAFLLMKFAVVDNVSDLAMRGAMGSALGTGSGVLIALIFLAFCLFRYHNKIMETLPPDRPHARGLTDKQAFGVILSVVTPFILSTFIYNFSTSLNQTIYTKIMKLQYSMHQSQIAINYGIFAGKAVVIANIPIALSSAMSSAIIPSISASFAKGDEDKAKEQIATAVKATMLIAIPSAVGIAALAEPITGLLFPQKQSLSLASMLLVSISITIIFYSLSTLTNAVLQGMGKVNTPVKHAAAALVVQTIVLVLLLKFTGMGLYSLSIAMVVYSFLMCILNQLAVKRALDYRQEVFKTFIIPFYAAALMGTFAHAAYRVIHDLSGSRILSLFLAVLFSIGVYVILVLRHGGITEKELSRLPKGRMVLSVLKKLRLMYDPEKSVHRKLQQKRKERNDERINKNSDDIT